MESFLKVIYKYLIRDKKLNTLDIKNVGSRELHKLETFNASYLNIKLPQSKQFRSNPLEVFCKKGVLKNFAKFRGKNLCLSRLQPATLLKRNSGTGVLSFAKFLRTTFLYNTSGRLLLTIAEGSHHRKSSTGRKQDLNLGRT